MAVRSVLEDHETGILELEGQMELLEKRVRDVETFAAVVFTMETRVQDTQKLVAELGRKLEKSVRDLKKQWDSKVTELESNCVLTKLLEVRAGWLKGAPGPGTCRQEHGAMGRRGRVKVLTTSSRSCHELGAMLVMSGAPPAQGGIQILGAPVGHVPVIMQRRLSVLVEFFGTCLSLCNDRCRGSGYDCRVFQVIMRQSTEASSRILDSSSRCSHLEIWCTGSSRPCIWQACMLLYLGVALKSTVLWILWEMSSHGAQCLARQWIHVMQSGYCREERKKNWILWEMTFFSRAQRSAPQWIHVMLRCT